MIAILDASAAIEVVLHRPKADTIAGVLRSADLTVAPDLYVSEITNAIWKYVRAGGNPDEYAGILLDAVQIVDDLIPSTELFREAFDLSTQHLHPVYDSMYLVAAIRNQASLLTLDKRLRTVATELGVSVLPSKPEQQ